MIKGLSEIVKGKKVIIAGSGKMRYDFEYVFDEILPEAYICDGALNTNVIDDYILLDSLRGSDVAGRFIIICASKESNYERRFVELGLKGRGEDYIFAEDLFELLDFNLLREASGRKIAFWDYSPRQDAQIKKAEALRSLSPDVVVSNSPNIVGAINFAEALENKKGYYFVITSNDYKNAYDILTRNGLNETIDFVSWKRLEFETGAQRPSSMMLETYYAPSYKQVECLRPFQYAFLNANGIMDCCCVSRINKSYGNFAVMNFDDVWNSNVAKVFRLSMINKTYCFCNIDKCFILKPNAEQAVNERMKKIPKVAKTPVLVQVCIDNSCNLHCPSCRKEVIVADKVKQDNIAFNAERLLKSHWLDNAETIFMAGNGEVFFSKAYRKLLYDDISAKRKNIHILSNGTLFNEKEFLHLQENYDEITVSLSIDSLEKDVYEKLRAGAKYSVIMDNLKMLAQKRKSNELKRFEIFVVVQMENLYELPDFIKKCVNELNVDWILLNPIHKGGVYTEETFRSASLLDNDGKIKEEVKKVFDNPIFRLPQVSMSWFDNRFNE